MWSILLIIFSKMGRANSHRPKMKAKGILTLRDFHTCVRILLRGVLIELYSAPLAINPYIMYLMRAIFLT